MSERERLARRPEAASNDRKRLRAKLDATEAELEQTRWELAKATAWLHALERSPSWRLTVPLRRLSGAIRGRRSARGDLP